MPAVFYPQDAVPDNLQDLIDIDDCDCDENEEPGDFEDLDDYGD